MTSSPPARPLHDAVKRVFDMTLGTGILAATCPILVGAAIAVKLDSPGPVFFRQMRLGRYGKPFSIFKLRTMVDGAASKGSGIETSKGDARITRVGAFLRDTRIDELPQLLNVLKGEMSLVGPRPLLPELLPYYSERDKLRLLALPGMTGWQQVHGASKHSWKERIDYDVWYVENASLWVDLKTLFLTVSVVLKRDSVYAPDGSQKSGLPDAYVAEKAAQAAGDEKSGS